MWIVASIGSGLFCKTDLAVRRSVRLRREEPPTKIVDRTRRVVKERVFFADFSCRTNCSLSRAFRFGFTLCDRNAAFGRCRAGRTPPAEDGAATGPRPGQVARVPYHFSSAPTSTPPQALSVVIAASLSDHLQVAEASAYQVLQGFGHGGLVSCVCESLTLSEIDPPLRVRDLVQLGFRFSSISRGLYLKI